MSAFQRSATPSIAVALVAAALVGCDRGQAHHAHDGHDHREEEKTRQVTVWGERFEVFLEHPPIVAGRPVKLVTHVTEIASGEARREGPVTFRLRLGADAPTEHAVEAPARPGIYIPEIAFPKAGDWRVSLVVPFPGGTSEVDLGLFPVHADEAAAKSAEVPEAPEGISFLEEQQWRIRARIEVVGTRRVVERLKLPGVVKERSGARAFVTPTVSGRLLAPPGGVLPRIGDRVKAGQILAIVQPPFSEFAARIVEAEAEVLRTQAALELAKVELDRNRGLHASGALPESEVQKAESAVRSARASYDAAMSVQRAYHGSGAVFVHEGCSCPAKECPGLPAFELRAPIAGVVTRVGASLGEVVFTAEGATTSGRADRGVFEVLDPSVVLVEARIHEADLARLGREMRGWYELPGDGDIRPIGGGDGAVPVFVGTEVDAATRTVPIVRGRKRRRAPPRRLERDGPRRDRARRGGDPRARRSHQRRETDGAR